MWKNQKVAGEQLGNSCSRRVRWEVLIGDEFEPEFQALHVDVQNEILAFAILVTPVRATIGTTARRHVEGFPPREYQGIALRRARRIWRVAFAFDPKRRAILLIADDKSGGSERRFYRELIRRAGDRFDAHLERVKQEQEKEKHKKERK